jgi:uncharacterized protein with ParB-like and HNH nuclease domain
MQASETKLRQLIEGTKQYVVPLFQRPYSWSEKQWKVLWTDVHEKARHADGRPHFFGSIVTTPAKSVPQGVGKFLLIDGQQRLTTVQVLLAALRDLADARGVTPLRDRIEGQYLTNTYEEGDEKLKILPTQNDRPAFRAIIWKHQPIPPSLLKRCYEYYLGRLDRLSTDDLDALHRAAVDRLSLVSITCDEHDNPHLIFESLNAKGEKLTPADLIRNFLLMQVHVADQDRLFRVYWEPIQQALGASLTEFVRHYLMKEGRILQVADVYFELKDRLTHATPAQAEDFLRDLHRHGTFYARFLNPQSEPDPNVADRLDRIRRLKVTVAYPFLLRVFDAHDAGRLTPSQVIETLDLLESFVIRRSVGNIPTNQLRRIFPPVFDAAGGPGPGFLDGLRAQFGGSRCPDDEAFAAALRTEPLYAQGEKNTRLRLILERLERSFGHKEPADLSRATIEHVLPRTLTPAWREHFGDDAITRSYDRLLHTLGNLTLSAYNSELSNQPFDTKRQALIDSHLDLNQHFRTVTHWTEATIAERAAALAEQALQVWPDPGRGPDSGRRVKRKSSPPRAVRFQGVDHPCRNWRDGFVQLVRQFEAFQPGFLEQTVDEGSLPAHLSRDPARFAVSKEAIGPVFLNTHGNAQTLQDRCRKLAERAGVPAADYGFMAADATGD